MSGPFPSQIRTLAEEQELEGAGRAALRPLVSWVKPGEARLPSALVSRRSL